MVKPWITAAELSNPNSADAEYAIEVASWLLWRMSGEKYGGINTTTEWYGTDSCCLMSATLISAGISTAHVLRGHDTGQTKRLRLRNQPVRAIGSVSLNNTVISPTEYYLANNSVLVRRNCDWDLGSGLEVTYTYGQRPPLAGRHAASKLADEFILSWSGSDDCALPARVRSVQRPGISFEMLDPQDFIDKGRFGLYDVDMFLAAANPGGARKRARIIGGGIPRAERRT